MIIWLYQRLQSRSHQFDDHISRDAEVFPLGSYRLRMRTLLESSVIQRQTALKAIASHLKRNEASAIEVVQQTLLLPRM